MRYTIDMIQHVFICGWNDTIIDNPFRWYEDCGLQLVYNYGRIEGNNQIIVKIPHTNWLHILQTYNQQIFVYDGE